MREAGSHTVNVVAVVQARMGSTRLPGKILADIAGEPMLARVVTRCEVIEGINEVVVATSELAADDVVAQLCDSRGWACIRGSEADVLDRYHLAARRFAADHVMRVTADCPLLCPRQGAEVVRRHLEDRNDYTHNLTVWGSSMPLGTGVEVFTFDALDRSWREGHEPHHREHVDEYVGDHPELFRIGLVTAPAALQRPDYRITVDTPEDLELARRIYEGVKPAPGGVIDVLDVVTFLDEHPDLLSINRHVRQKLI